MKSLTDWENMEYSSICTAVLNKDTDSWCFLKNRLFLKFSGRLDFLQKKNHFYKDIDIMMLIQSMMPVSVSFSFEYDWLTIFK